MNACDKFVRISAIQRWALQRDIFQLSRVARLVFVVVSNFLRFWNLEDFLAGCKKGLEIRLVE